MKMYQGHVHIRKWLNVMAFTDYQFLANYILKVMSFCCFKLSICTEDAINCLATLNSTF